MELRPGAAAILFFDHNKQKSHAATMLETEGITPERSGAAGWEFSMRNRFPRPASILPATANRTRRDRARFAGRGRWQFVARSASDRSGRLSRSRLGFAPPRSSDFLDIGEQVPDAKRKQAMVKQAFATLRRLATDDEDARPYILRPGNPPDVV